MQGGTFGSSKKQLIPENELTKIISNDEAKSIVDTLNSINDKTNETWDSTDSYLTFLKGKGKGYVTDYVKANQNQVYITEDVIQASKDARAAQIAQNEAVKEGTLSFKAGQVALKGLALGANILATYLVTKLITAYSDYKNKIHEVAQEATEQAEKSSGYVENLIKLQSELQNGTKSSDELTTAFKEQLQTMGYTESEIDTLISKYNGLSAAINMLSTMGVSNAQEIVNHVISAKNAYRELAVAVGETTYSTENLEEATISDMYALLNEGDMADKTKNQILAYYLQKQSAAGLQFSSEADCEQLKAIVSVLGVASSAWDTYYEHNSNTYDSKRIWDRYYNDLLY